MDMKIAGRWAPVAGAIALTFALAMPGGEIVAQAKKKEPKTEEQLKAAVEKAIRHSKETEAFFFAAEPLPVTLTTNVKRIRGDKGDKAPWRPARISFTDASGKVVSLPTELRTRGIWRLKNCEFPPLRVNFKADSAKGTMFQGLDKPKLVNYCRNTDDYEQFIIQELQLYRIYNLLTPFGYRARLLQVTYTDSASGKVIARRAAILLEEPEMLAARMGGPRVEDKGAKASDLEPYHDALIGIFQYFIGNTDFSIAGLHNVELVSQPAGDIIPIPYDFDFSGVINAPYATVDPKLSVQRVRDRLFRGYCVEPEAWAKAIAKFNEQKDAVYGLYRDSIGKLIKQKTVEETLKYYDDFFRIVNDSRRAKREIAEACVKTS
ncbi:MAG: hypothetical protein Q7S20_05625 [Gemmatimonadaceae bacterium]|nr:hypothetical protein [Gemmatimonadaceae bacterium]